MAVAVEETVAAQHSEAQQQQTTAQKVERPQQMAEQQDVAPAKRLFTVAEFYKMAKAGIIKPAERVELIEGEVVFMSPLGDPHAACVDRMAELLIEYSQRKLIIRVQSHIRLSDTTTLQPDLSVLRRREDFYSEAPPGPSDVLLVVEVSDTTLRQDRGRKRRLYGRAGIPELWIVNLPQKKIEVYSQVENGDYETMSTFKRGEQLVSVALPDFAATVEDILGSDKPAQAETEASA